MIEISLEGKRALITGSASGIGKATAILFAKCGAELILIDKDESGLQELKKILKNVKIKTYTFDLSVKDEIDEFWKKLEELPDILINNAGIYPFQDFLEVDKKSLEYITDVNLNSMFWMCQNFIRRKKKKGIIVNISSIEAILPFKEDLIPYSISKAGVISLTRSIARDFGKKEFRANVILPGAIKTKGTQNLAKKAISHLSFNLIKTGRNFNQRLPLGKWGQPEDVAKVILFLSSDLAAYVQGAVIPVDGGFLSN